MFDFDLLMSEVREQTVVEYFYVHAASREVIDRGDVSNQKSNMKEDIENSQCQRVFLASQV